MAAANPDETGHLGPHEWVLDSGATSHMTPHQLIFTTYKRLMVETRVKVANGAYMTAIAKGDVAIQLPSGRQVIQGVYHVPELLVSLLSEMGLTRSGISLFRTSDSTRLLRGDRTVAIAEARDNHWVLSAAQPEVALAAQASAANAPYELWYWRLGHLGKAKIGQLHTTTIGLPGPIGPPKTASPCSTCLLAKQTRVNRRNAPQESTRVL